MKKGVTIGIIIGVILVLLIIGFFVLTNTKENPTDSQNEDSNEMLDCGVMDNPTCFSNRMSECLPVTAKLVGTDGSDIDITILGIEDEKCHFQREINGVVNLNCYFPKGTMNWDTIDQTFGNDKGLQSIVDEACKTGW
jgi:uncharacterized protein (UPF0333 family)